MLNQCIILTGIFSDFEYVIISIRHNLWEICTLNTYIYIYIYVYISIYIYTYISIVRRNFSLNISLHNRASDHITLFIVIHKSLLTYREKKGKGR